MSKRTIISTEVNKAEIYYSGAIVQRKGRIALQRGTNVFFLQIPVMQRIKELKVDFLQPVNHLFIKRCGEETIQHASEEQKKKEQDLNRIKVQKAALSEQADAYKRNTCFTGHNNISIKEMVEFLEKLPEVLVKIRNQMDALEEQEEVLQEELKEMEEIPAKTVAIYQISLSAPEEGEYEFQAEYRDHSIWWEPFYDIHVTDISKPLDFQLKGKITMNTGENWNQVSLELFSGALSDDHASHPSLKPWYVDVESPYRTTGARMMPPPGIMHTFSAPMANGDACETTVLSSMPEQVALGTMRKFVIPQTREIRSGEQETILDIFSVQVPSEFFYATTPKVIPAAFLIAKIQDVSSYDLLACEANLYLEGIYRGTTYLASKKTEQTLMLSLGQDPSIEVSRKNVRLYTQDRLGKRSRQYEYEIYFANMKKDTVHIDIYDQIPVSRNKNIVVENIRVDDSGTVDPVTGKVVWAFSTPPQFSYVIRFGFTVTWPKEEQINL